MKWNPFVNGVAAAGYVWGVVLLINHIASLHHDTPDNLTGTVAAISLVVFSVSVMAFLFFYRPAVLLIEHKTGEAAAFFLKTLATFGALALIAILTVV